MCFIIQFVAHRTRKHLGYGILSLSQSVITIQICENYAHRAADIRIKKKTKHIEVSCEKSLS